MIQCLNFIENYLYSWSNAKNMITGAAYDIGYPYSRATCDKETWYFWF